MRRATRWASATAFLAVSTFSGAAFADEPRSAAEPDVMRDPAEVTAVVDAFDGKDLFDLHLTLGFQQSFKSSVISRETFNTDPEYSSGGFTAFRNVAQYNEVTTRLNTRMDVGLYKDVALFARLPIILSNDRKLRGIDGSEKNQSDTLVGYPGEQLFRIPFDSPTRSGIEYLALGLQFDILNQWRDPSKPTWKLALEGRFNVSEPMHACNEAPASGTEKCAYPSDINRNGKHDNDLEGGNFSGGRGAGVSRGTTAFGFQTVMSKRIKYIEPYAGLSGLFEFQNKNTDFGRTDLKGALVNHPPFQGKLILGTAIIPWERLETFERLEFDTRFSGTYRSEGRDYSELFDALGSSPAASLREPKFAEYQAGTGDAPSVVNPDSSKVYMTGITDVQQHGIYTFRGAVTWQSGKWMKFGAGTALTFVQGHLITFDQPCNPDIKDAPEKSGPCRVASDNNPIVTGVPNANYREVINIPGRRFKVDSSTVIDFWLNATLMF